MDSLYKAKAEVYIVCILKLKGKRAIDSLTSDNSLQNMSVIK